jgi:hypothetical protein
MDNNQTEKSPQAGLKSFMTVGPTLHYSHENVQRYWMLAMVVFGMVCLFWTKLRSGSFLEIDLGILASPKLWGLGQSVISGISIFEYPWQILVLGLLMGIFAAVPVLVSQLMSFIYSVPLILAVAFLANLPGFAVCLLISCIAAACRPLRFRSRFTAIALCMAPQLFYWGCFGGATVAEPVKWGFSFTPWICAWLAALAIAGLVLSIGHFTRYRPGVVWMVTFFVLLTAVVVFETKISFDELDYQLYVAKNDPERINEFQDHSITKALDETITNPAVRRYLEGFFYPAEPIPLRTELKNEIQLQLAHDRWPYWFMISQELDYQAKKQWLFEQYDLFITRRFKSRRMPISLYYKALLSEYSPDIEMLGQKEVLHFYSDYPYEKSREVWYRLYSDFDRSAESLEARWRIAKHWAGQGRFEQADKLLGEAQLMAAERLKILTKQRPQTDTLFSLFQPPADSVMTISKLIDLQRKMSQLQNLISPENRTRVAASEKHLAEFVMFNPHSRDYARQLDRLLKQTKDNDPLRDNILLAQITLVADEELRVEKLNQLHKKFPNSDGGIQALYELALLKISLWRQQSDSTPEQKKKYLADARNVLTDFVNLYPDSIFAEQVKKNLADLPSTE